MIVIEKEVFRLHLPMDEKKNWSRFRVVLTKEMQGGNIKASRQQSDYSTYSFCQEMKGCRRKCKLNYRYTKLNLRLATTRRQNWNNHTALGFVISFTTDLARRNEKRRALRCSKNQIDRVLSRIFIRSHCKARSHNPKGSCARREQKKYLFSITQTVKFRK